MKKILKMEMMEIHLKTSLHAYDLCKLSQFAKYKTHSQFRAVQYFATELCDNCARAKVMFFVVM